MSSSIPSSIIEKLDLMKINKNANTKPHITSTGDLEASAFAEQVMANLEMLKKTGKIYRRNIYKLSNVLELYINNMKIKHANMGEKYVSDMIVNINTIFNGVSIYSYYDILEYINLVVIYYFKLLGYKYTKNKVEPQLPDYTLPEIKELSKLRLCDEIYL
jgi:hypothetical protein